VPAASGALWVIEQMARAVQEKNHELGRRNRELVNLLAEALEHVGCSEPHVRAGARHVSSSSSSKTTAPGLLQWRSSGSERCTTR
jgi:hypothetical protein